MKKILVVSFVIILVAVIVYVLSSRKKGALESQSMQRDKLSIAAIWPDTIEVCSFNIQFLGSFKKRDDEALADILKDYDIVVVQELVAPPYDGIYPDGESYTGDTEAAEFFDAMQDHGFSYWLSEEDTGTGDDIHKKSSATEWFVSFYKPNIVAAAFDLPHGFLAEDRSNNADFERVPFAFSFRSSNHRLDFVLISVHLQPGDRPSERERRAHELSTISTWIEENSIAEQDHLILGDMNIYDAEELADITPPGFLSLNDECRMTNTLSIAGKGEPNDHVMYNPAATSEIDAPFDIFVVDLINAMRPYWQEDAPFPGDPYVHNTFKQYYSDHFPVVFRLITPMQDDDGVAM